MNRRAKPEFLALVVVCVVTNLGMGFVVAALKLPFYLDSIGTVLATAIGGPAIGIATAVVSVIVGSLYTPTLWAYALTGVAISLYTTVCLRLGYLSAVRATVAWGLGLGVISAIASAPVTAFLWGGVSFSGSDAITAYFRVMGSTLLDSVLLSGLATDPIDKLFTSLIAYAVLRRLPDRLKLPNADSTP